MTFARTEGRRRVIAGGTRGTEVQPCEERALPSRRTLAAGTPCIAMELIERRSDVFSLGTKVTSDIRVVEGFNPDPR